MEGRLASGGCGVAGVLGVIVGELGSVGTAVLGEGPGSRLSVGSGPAGGVVGGGVGSVDAGSVGSDSSVGPDSVGCGVCEWPGGGTTSEVSSGFSKSTSSPSSVTVRCSNVSDGSNLIVTSSSVVWIVS